MKILIIYKSYHRMNTEKIDEKDLEDTRAFAKRLLSA